MKREELIKKKVEEMGVFFETVGRTPVEGRIFAYLLLSEPPHRSFDDIKEFIQASKSTISNALTALQRETTVGYVTFSGDRKRYFKINLENWLRKRMGSIEGFSHMNSLVEDTIAMRKDNKYKDFNEGLKKVHDFNEYLAETCRVATEKWKKKNL